MLELVTADKLQLDIFSVFGTNNGLLMAGHDDWLGQSGADLEYSYVHRLCTAGTVYV